MTVYNVAMHRATMTKKALLPAVSTYQDDQHKRILRLSLYIVFVTTGVLTTIGYAGWLIYICVVPLFWYVDHSVIFSKRTIIKDFFWSGSILSLIAYIFIMQLAPQNWTVFLNGWASYLVRGAGLGLVSLVGGMAFMILGYVFAHQPSHNQRLFVILIGWPLAELLRSFLMSILCFGPGGNIGFNYNFGALAVATIDTPLVYLSRIIGFVGLSYLAINIAFLIYLIIKRRHLARSLTVIALIILIDLYCWQMGNYAKKRQLSVSAVHLASSSDMAKSGISSLPYPTDLLVLPEYSGIEQAPQKTDLLKHLAPNGIAISSVAHGSPPTTTNRQQFYNQSAQVVFEQDKTLLIPTGEYMPYSISAILWMTGQNSVNYDFHFGQQIAPGRTTPKIYRSGDVSYGALVCSGAISLDQYQDLVGQGADVLVNSASLSFLSEHSLYFRYAHSMARFWAISTKKPFVQASRNGESLIIDRQGRVVRSANTQDDRVLSAKIGIQ